MKHRSAFLAILLLLLTTGAARAQQSRPQSAPPAKKDLPTFDLTEKPAFPLDHHLESKELAAGTMKLSDIYEDGAKLFHTPYNGLDGVGVHRLPSGATVADASRYAVDTQPIWIASMENSSARVGSAILTAERSNGVRNPARIAIKSAVFPVSARDIKSVYDVAWTG